jgi:hypothetical protein
MVQAIAAVHGSSVDRHAISRLSTKLCLFSSLTSSLTVYPCYRLNELSPTTLREIAEYLQPVETQALSSYSRRLNGWSRKLVLKQITLMYPC